MINIAYDALGLSFTKVARLAADGFRRIGYTLVNLYNAHLLASPPPQLYVVGDIVLACSWGWLHRLRARKSVLWCDTPLCLDGLERLAPLINESYCVVATLTWLEGKLREAGVEVGGVAPRPGYFYTARAAPSGEGWRARFGDYVVTVGSDQVLLPARPPRKGLDMFDGLARYLRDKYGLRAVAVSNWPYFRHAIRVPAGSLSEVELMSLIKGARLFVWPSRGEGFGMPPIEAMAAGQLVVCSDAPFNEFVVGVKFDCHEESKVYMPEAGRYYYCYDYDLESLCDAVSYALSLDEEERRKIVGDALSLSKFFRQDFIAELLAEL